MRVPFRPGRRQARSRWVLLAAVAIIAAPFAIPTADAISDVSATLNPDTGFPMWYEDGASTALEPCIGVNCAAVLPDPAAAAAVPGNFPDVANYYSAQARTTTNFGGVAQISYTLIAGFAGGIPAAGDQVVIARTRMHVDHLQPNRTYAITHPDGVETLDANNGGVIDIQLDKVGCEAPCDFTLPLTSKIGNFLRWDPAITPLAPAGFIGDPATPHQVVGSAFGTNFFKVVGPNPVGVTTTIVNTNLFFVEGKRATAGFTAPMAPVDLIANPGPGPGELTVTWSKPIHDGGLPVTTYDLFAGDSASALTLLASTPGDVKTFTETGLAQGATRFYALVAHNTQGSSGQSAIVSGTTFVVPGPPRNLVATSGPGVGEISLTWLAPLSNGGVNVSHYNLYRAQGIGDPEYVATLGDVRSYRDSGLLPVLGYHYVVRAVTEVGEGPNSNAACARSYPWVSALDGTLAC